MGAVNAAWHRAHRMPARATLEDRIRWHLEHARRCGCREMPASIRAALEARVGAAQPGRRPRGAAGAGGTPTTTHERIYRAVRRIPRGRVATYGDIARRVGLPRQARLVGYALHAAPPSARLPWHRVVNAQGRISLGRGVAGGDLEQRFRLEREGVEFDANGRISLARFRWAPSRRARK